MELIDREALLEEFEKENSKSDSDLWHITGIKAFIENAPTIESRPRGEWKQRTDFDEDNNAIFECSNCLHGDVQAKGSEVPFCWYCGASMQSKCEVKAK